MSDAPAPKTYVLAGFDHNKALKEANRLYSKDPAHFVVLDVASNHNLEDALSKITPQANVFLDCHGYDNVPGNEPSFQWKKDERIPYAKLLDSLKQAKSLTICSCEGGLAENPEILAHAPAGLIVQTAISDTNLELGDIITRFADSNVKHPATDPITFYIRGLSAFTPQDYKGGLAAYKTNHPKEVNVDENPEHALPHVIGIGGKPPLLIDIRDQTSKLSAALHTNGSNEYWDKAVQRICRIFGATPDMSSTGDTAEAVALKMWAGVTPEGTDSKGTAIALVAAKMKGGEKISGVQEERIAYALTAAYMRASGELEKMVEQQKEAAKSKQHPASGPHVQADIIKQQGEILAAITQGITTPLSITRHVDIAVVRPLSPDTKQIG